jgi:hypothetical protein
MEIKKSDFKCIYCGNYCYEELWGENDTTLVCYVCKRQSELKKREERKAKKNEQFMKCAELLQGIMRTEYDEILTDIRDYLVAWRDNNAIDYSAERWIDETALADLTEYAENLGVEL